MAWDGLNRRKFPRVFFPCLIKIRNSKDLLLTHTENISSGGVRLILKNSLEFGATLRVEIDLMDADDPIVCEGKVVWSEQRKKDELIKPLFYDIGIEFTGIPSKDRKRLDAIVDHHLKLGKVI